MFIFPLRLRHDWDITTFWPVNKALIWADVWELALPCWTMIRPLLYVFFFFFKSLGRQIVWYDSELTVRRCSSGTVAIWPVLNKKQAIICFQVLLPRITFVGFGSTSKTHTVHRCTDPRFVTCDDLINVFWGTAIVFSNISLHHSTRTFFWSIVK